MKESRSLSDAFRCGLAPGGDLSSELRSLDDFCIETVQDAKIFVTGLAEYAVRPIEQKSKSAFHQLILLFQTVAVTDAFLHLSRHGIPLLIKLYDARLSSVSDHRDDLMFALKIFGRYATEEGLDRLVVAATDPVLSNGFLWHVIFEQLKDRDPIIPELLRRLSMPLPTGYAAGGFLGWSNRLLREGIVEEHPFNSEIGADRLQDWLLQQDDDAIPFAHCAAGALPFIGEPARSRLLALAMDHRNVGVQMEAAWASARLGSESGIKFLSRMCLERDHSSTACTYLEELDRDDAIPESAFDPDFVALAEMCQWLAHPNEYGRPPDEIELFDARELHWPPTDDWRSVWLFKFAYREDGPADSSSDDDALDDASLGEVDVGIGMAGSITFSLTGETTAEMSPEDIYALHCCWELEIEGDPRAPDVRTIAAGRELLDAAPRVPPEPDEDF